MMKWYIVRRMDGTWDESEEGEWVRFDDIAKENVIERRKCAKGELMGQYTSKQQYELETGEPAEIIIKYDSPEYLCWYIKKRLNKAENGCECCADTRVKMIAEYTYICQNCGKARP